MCPKTDRDQLAGARRFVRLWSPRLVVCLFPLPLTAIHSIFDPPALTPTMCRRGRTPQPHPALTVAFEALEAMREKVPAGEEAVYRSLISACGRCGNSEKAMAVVEVSTRGETPFWKTLVR